MADPGPRYRVVVWDLDEYLREFGALPESQQRRVADLYNNHLPVRPNQMRPDAGLKRLRGQHSHLRQFDCGGGKRLLYEVDEENMVVRILYLGKHPEWDKRDNFGG